MNWEAVGAVGELVGAVTVIVTLFYIARQIKQNNRALTRSNEFAKANSIHQINASFSSLYSHLASDGELADIYTRALSGERLTPTEETRFTSFTNMYLAILENLAEQQSLELGFSALDSDSAVVLMAPELKKLLDTDFPLVAGIWAGAVRGGLSQASRQGYCESWITGSADLRI